MSQSRTLTVKWNVRVPTVPNYLLSSVDDSKVDIAHVSDDGLREIAAAWTEELLKHAANRRKPR